MQPFPLKQPDSVLALLLARLSGQPPLPPWTQQGNVPARGPAPRPPVGPSPIPAAVLGQDLTQGDKYGSALLEQMRYMIWLHDNLRNTRRGSVEPGVGTDLTQLHPVVSTRMIRTRQRRNL